jgi:hypothetical protein
MEHNPLSNAEALIYLCLILLVVFLPTVIAYCRQTHNRLLVFAINLLFGWSGVGWIIALVMALGSLSEDDLCNTKGSVTQTVTVVVGGQDNQGKLVVQGRECDLVKGPDGKFYIANETLLPWRQPMQEIENEHRT